MNLFVKVSREHHKGKKLDKMLHDYFITKKQVSFYVVGHESWFEFLENKKAIFKFTDEENEINMFLKGTVKLNGVCDAMDGNSGLYVLEVKNWKELNNTNN